MFEKIEECPVCNNDKIINHIICKDHMLTGESFSLTQCSNCSFLFTNPRPIAENIGKYYQSEKYISHSNKANNLINLVYKFVRKFTLSQKVKLINTISSEKSILDFGCGTGEFLLSCKKDKWKINGFEPDNNAREKANVITKINITANFQELKQIENVSLITLWHVLEHIPELNKTFKILKSKLSNTGKFLIAVPNYQSFDAMHYREFWAAYDVPRHLYHFSMKTMQLFLNNHGLNIYRIIPMKFDSFYVSLLSEKYKYGKSNYIKSFINGYKSNIYAKYNNNNYSSLIYIAGK